MSIALNIELGEDVRALRIDPAEFPCIVRLLSLEICDGDGKPVDTAEIGNRSPERTSFYSNGVDFSDQTFFFGHDDPQLKLSDLPTGRKTVRVRYRVEALAGDVLADMDAFLSRKESELAALKKEKAEAEQHRSLTERLKAKVKKI